jgi:hypothetical protein
MMMPVSSDNKIIFLAAGTGYVREFVLHEGGGFTWKIR